MLPFTNRTVNFAEVPLWDYPDWILPYEPITEEEAMDYPWNWDFDEFKRRITKYNRNEIIEYYTNRPEEESKIHRKHDEEFLEWIKITLGIHLTPLELPNIRPHPSKRLKGFVKKKQN